MSNKKSKLIIGISSRALFNLDESHEIYKKQGLKSYQDYQIENEDNTLAPGEAFNLVEKILKINDLYESSDRVEVILLSRNTSDTGLRIRNSIEEFLILNPVSDVFLDKRIPLLDLNYHKDRLFLKFFLPG